MPIKFPITKITDSQKYGFCYKLQEALRLLHNSKQQEKKEGKIDQKDWENWFDNYYTPRADLVDNIICDYRNLIRLKNITDNPQDVKIDEVIIL